MRQRNTHGLSRYIPIDVRREVRQRSKFGCVVCRAGITEFEHIDPPFADAEFHDADNICLLCASCHAKVTRQQLSKQRVAEAYRLVSAASPQEVPAPRDTFDLSRFPLRLSIGGFIFRNGAPVILKDHGTALIEIIPGGPGVPFGINATFFNGAGVKTLEIEHNTWIGPTDSGDFYVEGPRMYIQDSVKMNSLVLRAEPPDGLVVERLDMRVGRHHVLANETRHAIGCFDGQGDPIWYYCLALPQRLYDDATVIELAEPEELQARHDRLPERRKHMNVPHDLIKISEIFGIGSIEHGVVFCANTGWQFLRFARGRHTIEAVRSAVFERRDYDMTHILSRGASPLAYDVEAQARDFPSTMKVGEGLEVLIDYSAIVHGDLPYPR